MRLGLIVVGAMWALSVCAQTHRLDVLDTDNSPLPDNSLRALAISPDSALWVGTENGLAIYQQSQWQIPATFANQQIRALAFDMDGKAWVGTFLNGLWQQTDTGWVNHTTANSPLPGDFVRAVAFCPNGDTWIGTVAGAARIRNGAWTVYRQSNTNWWTENIACAYCSEDNDVWLGGINSGLMHQADTSWQIFRNNNSGLPDNTVLDIQGIPYGMWLAMPAAGASVFDGGLSWVHYNSVTSGNPSNSINKLALGHNGRVYLASADKGLVVYEGGFSWFYLSSLNQPDTSGRFLPSDELTAVVQHPDGTAWAASAADGLFKITFIDSATAMGSMMDRLAINLFPNPATDYIMVDGPVAATVTITDLLGQTWVEGYPYSSHSPISIGHLPAGVYLLQVNSVNGQGVQRFIKR